MQVKDFTRRVQYLIRVDDLCPTMDWRTWAEIERIFIEEDVRPLLGVIPDNRDTQLHQSPRNDQFWDHVRAWQARGWTIGLHGYQHVYVSDSAGIIGLNRYSEFAGLSFDEQYYKLTAALQIFQRESIKPDLWIAPAHTFDSNTIKALALLGIRVINDGFHLFPYLDSDGIFWIPQQLGDFYQLPFGLWTVCLHMDDPIHADIPSLRRKIQRFRQLIVDFPTVLARHSSRRSTLLDRRFASIMRWSKRLKQQSILKVSVNEG